jgi:DHA3 family macrolide efflux protein-like MFS transporter
MSQLSDAAKLSPFAVFRNRDFTYLWVGDLVSQFGSGITSIAASILVFRETGSALSVGLMLIATSLPGFLFGLIAGVFVDRLDRKRIMLVCEVLRAILVFLIPVMLPFGIWWLYILVALSAMVTQFFNPAHGSVIPDVASDEELAAANSMMSISSTGAMGLGFAAAGLITSRYPVEWAFYIDALTFLLSGLAILLVKVRPLEVEEETSVRAVARNLSEGLRFIWDSRILRSTFIVVVPMAILFGFHNSLLLPFADRALSATEFEYGLIEGLSMVGFVVGGLVMASLADRLREGQWLAISFIGMGLETVIYSHERAVFHRAAIDHPAQHHPRGARAGHQRLLCDARCDVHDRHGCRRAGRLCGHPDTRCHRRPAAYRRGRWGSLHAGPGATGRRVAAHPQPVAHRADGTGPGSRAGGDSGRFRPAGRAPAGPVGAQRRGAPATG